MFYRRVRVCLGEVHLRNDRLQKVCITLDDLLRHQYVIGATGSGKSTLIINEVLDAFRQGLCTWVLDPHGDLAYDIVEAAYPEDLDRVFLFDPLKVKFSLNPFELPHYSDSDQRSMMVERMVGEIVNFMKRMYGERYWGPSLNRIFQNALRELYSRDDSPTFEEMLNLVKEKIEDEKFEDFYEELDALPRGRTDAVINKLEPFVKNEVLKRIFCRKVSTIDVEELLSPGLVIWRLSKGELSEMNSGLIGSALITRLWLSAVSRERGERPPVFLAVDEFQNFAHLETLGDLVTEGRKYGIGLLLAHQHTEQLPRRMLADVLGNTATKIIFRVPQNDARTISNSLGYPDRAKLMQVLTSLPDGKAVVKLRAGFGEKILPPFEIFTFKPPVRKHNFTGKLIERMRMLYEAPVLPQQISFKPELDSKLTDVLKAVYELGEKGLETTRTNISRNISISGSELSGLLDKAQSMSLVERVVRKEGRGRPKVLTYLTEKGLKAIGIGVTAGSSSKAGGELHRALLFRVKEWLEEQGYTVEIPEQGGSKEQPDMIAKPGDGGREIAVEIETSANHPEQIRRNYEKNIKLGRFVVFVVPDEEVEYRVKKYLGKIGSNYKIYKIPIK
ncbi:ATP-binding protein [Methanophagales archaeon]|nr:MAG: ATP-binding protein [Methanophagales archaeon]